MKSKKTLIILLNLVLLLVFFNFSVFKKEQTLANGELVLLELAPVDPRSLMQGDYMQLNYALTTNLQTHEKLPSRGFAVVTQDKNKVAKLERFQKDKEPLQNGEKLIRYFKTGWSLNIGAESYFFEEGQAETFANAKYGGLKIDEEGNSILVGLYNENRQLLKPNRNSKNQNPAIIQ